MRGTGKLSSKGNTFSASRPLGCDETALLGVSAYERMCDRAFTSMCADPGSSCVHTCMCYVTHDVLLVF